jgi:catechol 2,3-dioxygenase-like lactoylglutathione lyase family enzyme
MTAALKGLGAITLFVEDLQRSKPFYRHVFGLRMIFQDDSSAAFDFDNTIINLLSLPAARELIEPGAVAAPEAGSRLQLTIWVDDADAACAELEARGLTLLNGPLSGNGECEQPASPIPPATSGNSRRSSPAPRTRSRVLVLDDCGCGSGPDRVPAGARFSSGAVTCRPL